MSPPTAVATAPRPQRRPATAREGISNAILGMILFICSEVMFFAGLFAAYFNVRANAPIWPPTARRARPSYALAEQSPCTLSHGSSRSS